MVPHRSPRILTEIPSNPCDHLMVPHRSPRILTEIPSNPCDHLMVPHRSPINKHRWLHSRRHPILTEVPQKFLKQCLFLWLPSIQSLAKHPILTEVPSDLCEHNGPTLEPNKYKSATTVSSTSSSDHSKQCLSLWLPSIPVFPKAS